MYVGGERVGQRADQLPVCEVRKGEASMTRCFGLERQPVRAFYTFQPFTRLQVLELRERLAAFLAGRK